MKKGVKVTLWVVGIIIFLGIIGSAFNNSETNYQSGTDNPSTGKSIQTTSNENTQSDEKIKILNHEMKITDYGIVSVIGTAENVARRSLSYSEIRVKFYDSSGALLETSFDNVLDLGVGEKWSFEVIYLSLEGDNVARYEIGVGSVW